MTAHLQRVLRTTWRCPCGRVHTLLHDKTGRPYARCQHCASVIFVADLDAFLERGLCAHDVPTKKTKKRGMLTSFCYECLVRRFWRKPAAAPETL